MTPTTLTGGITNAGTVEGADQGLFISNDVRIVGDIVNSGLIIGGGHAVEITRASTVTGALRNSGTISGATGVLVTLSGELSGGIINTGTIIGLNGTAISLGAADDTVTLGTGSAITGITDAGIDDDDILNLEGMGSEDDSFVNFEQLNMNGEEWTLTSDLTLVEGPTLLGDVNINSGILYMNGTLTAPAGVDAIGGTLAGSGDIIANVTVGNGGTIAPGNSIGILSITGDVALGAGSFFDVEVEGSTADLLNVTGNVTIDPTSTVNVLPLGTSIDVVDQVIIDAGGTINANFQNIETNGLLATTELRGTSQIVLSAVSPVSTEVGSTAGTQDGFAFQNALASPGVGIGTWLIGPETQLWAKGVYEFNERDDSAGFAGFDQEIQGLVVGLDQSVTSSLRLGGALGYAISDVEINMLTGDVEIDSFHGGVYGIYEKNAFRLNFGAQAGRQDKDLTRPVIVSGVTTNVLGETHGRSYGAHAKGGWGIDINETWGSSLNLNAAYIHQSQNDYTDTSNVTFGELDTETVRFGPSVDVTGTFKTGDATLTPRASIGYLQQWTDGDDLIDVTFSSGLTQSASIQDRDEGFTTFGAGLDALFGNGVTAFVGYDGEYGDDETRNRITAGLRIGL